MKLLDLILLGGFEVFAVYVILSGTWWMLQADVVMAHVGAFIWIVTLLLAVGLFCASAMDDTVLGNILHARVNER